MVNFVDALNFLIEVGFVKVLAPFMLIFAIVFAILQKSKIFHGGANEDDSARKINAVIAFVFGIFAVISVNVITFLEQTLAVAAMVMVIILCMLLVLGLLLGDEYNKIFENSAIKYGLAILVFLLAIGFIFTVFGIWNWIANQFGSVTGGSGDTLGFLIIFGIIAAIIYWVTKSTDDDD